MVMNEFFTNFTLDGTVGGFKRVFDLFYCLMH